MTQTSNGKISIHLITSSGRNLLAESSLLSVLVSMASARTGRGIRLEHESSSGGTSIAPTSVIVNRVPCFQPRFQLPKLRSLSLSLSPKDLPKLPATCCQILRHTTYEISDSMGGPHTADLLCDLLSNTLILLLHKMKKKFVQQPRNPHRSGSPGPRHGWGINAFLLPYFHLRTQGLPQDSHQSSKAYPPDAYRICCWSPGPQPTW